jgi:hypothetical protein
MLTPLGSVTPSAKTTNSMVTGCLSDAVSLGWRETPQSDGDHAVEVPDSMTILAGDIDGTHSSQ